MLWLYKHVFIDENWYEVSCHRRLLNA